MPIARPAMPRPRPAFPDRVRASLEAVYRLEVVDANRGTRVQHGTAWVLCATTGVAITARHVVHLAAADSAVLVGHGDTIPVRGLLAEHVANDVAILALAAPVLPCLRAADEPAFPGDLVTAIGWPADSAPSMHRGVYLRRHVHGDSVRFESRAVLPKGASGGVLLNGRGEAVGVIHGIGRRDPSLGYATPLSLPTGFADRSVRRLAEVYGRKPVLLPIMHITTPTH